MQLTGPDGAPLIFAGPRDGPAAEWRLHDWRVLDDVMARGQIGLADAYIDGRWDSPDLEAMVTFGLVNAEQLEQFFHGRPLYMLRLWLRSLLRANSLGGSRRNIAAHYDLGNDFYRLWLDDSMTYSSALFEGDAARSLETAQQAKYARILGRLGAQPGEHILEIGCGWGGFAEAAARRGVRVTGLTLARTQAEFARRRMERAELDRLVEIRLED
jgi:cyclopropane-fatty-acyl-phospholipid synthase